MIKFRYVLFFLLLGLSTYGQKMENWSSGIEGQIKELMSKYKAVGLSVAVVKDNEVVYAQGFGHRDLEKKLPMTPNTVLPIGSISKSFTAAMLGVLEEQQLLSLKDRPSKHMSGLRFYNNEMDERIAIEDLLSHKSGIGDQGTTQIFFPDNSIAKTVKRLQYLEPQAEVKNSFAYSNMAYTLAGGIIEEVAGRSWEEQLGNTIFQPLEMKNSFTSYEAMKTTKNYSQGYGLYKDDIVSVAFENLYSIKPAGAIKSTALDMCNWMIAWLDNGNFKGKGVLPEAYVKKATTLQNISTSDYERDAYLFGDGFGWRLRSSYGHFRVEHGGNSFGFSTELMMFPFEKIGVVVLTNQNLSLLPYMVADAIVRRLLQQDPMGEYPVKVDEVYRPALKSKGVDHERQPSLPFDAYPGHYAAKGYGEIEILEKGDGLYAKFPTYLFKLEHLNFNSFYLKGTKDFDEPYSPEFTVKFTLGTNGKVDALKLYSQKDPIDFIKE